MSLTWSPWNIKKVVPPHSLERGRLLADVSLGLRAGDLLVAAEPLHQGRDQLLQEGAHAEPHLRQEEVKEEEEVV